MLTLSVGLREHEIGLWVAAWSQTLGSSFSSFKPAGWIASVSIFTNLIRLFCYCSAHPSMSAIILTWKGQAVHIFVAAVRQWSAGLWCHATDMPQLQLISGLWPHKPGKNTSFKPCSLGFARINLACSASRSSWKLMETVAPHRLLPCWDVLSLSTSRCLASFFRSCTLLGWNMLEPWGITMSKLPRRKPNIDNIGCWICNQIMLQILEDREDYLVFIRSPPPPPLPLALDFRLDFRLVALAPLHQDLWVQFGIRGSQWGRLGSFRHGLA